MCTEKQIGIDSTFNVYILSTIRGVSTLESDANVLGLSSVSFIRNAIQEEKQGKYRINQNKRNLSAFHLADS